MNDDQLRQAIRQTEGKRQDATRHRELIRLEAKRNNTWVNDEATPTMIEMARKPWGCRS